MSTRPVSAAGVAATVAALLAVIAGIIVAGSPSRAREQRLDHLRIDDLAQLSSVVDAYWVKHATLPQSLDSLVGAQELDRVLTDPQSGSPYTYLVSGERSYRLCANFSLASDSTAASSTASEPLVFVTGGSGEPPIIRPPHVWRHSAGKSCFDLTPPQKPAK